MVEFTSLSVFLFVIAMAISVLGNIVGLGGGIFLLPILLILTNLELPVAVSSVTISIFLSTLVSITMTHKTQKIDYRFAGLFEAPTMAATFLGALLVSSVDEVLLKCLFIIYLGYTVWTIIKKEKTFNFFNRLNRVGPSLKIFNGERSISYILLLYSGGLAGTFSGAFGVGGGIIKTPVMINVLSIKPSIASSHALVMICMTTFAGSLSHYFLGNINLSSTYPVVVGFLIGGILGTKVKLGLKESDIKKTLVFVIFLAMVMLTIEMI